MKDIYEIVYDFVTTDKKFELLRDLDDLQPFYRGWGGEIIKEDGKFVSKGNITSLTSNSVVVTAIPVETAIQTWIQKWKADPRIKKVINKSKYYTVTDCGPNISMMKPKIEVIFKDPDNFETLQETLNLYTKLHTTNMHLWSVHGDFKSILQSWKFYMNFVFAGKKCTQTEEI